MGFWNFVLDASTRVMGVFRPIKGKPLRDLTLIALRKALRSREPKSFREVREQEWCEIRVAREKRKGHDLDYPPAEQTPQKLTERNLVGLAFSGGGIRSATLNLGILQGLAKYEVLEAIDYLSAVSGGNYIASWLAAWIKRDGFRAVRTALSPDRACTGQEREAAPIRWLRDYSNYLTPRLGLFSGDTWTVVSTYLRNLFLNQTILVLVLGGAVLLPRVLTWRSAEWGSPSALNPLSLILPEPIDSALERFFGHGYSYFLIALALLIWGVLSIQGNMSWFAHAPGEDRRPQGETGAGSEVDEREERKGSWYGTKGVWLNIVVPLVLAAWLLTVWIWFGPAASSSPNFVKLSDGAGRYAVLIAILYALPWVAGAFTGSFLLRILGQKTKGGILATLAVPFSALFAGALGGVLLWEVGRIFQGWKTGEGSDLVGGLWLGMTWGPPLMLGVISLMAALHIGLMGLAFQEGKREWWSRLGGAILTAGLMWIALFGMGVYGPLLLMWMGAKLATGGFLGWVATTAAGVLGGKSPRTNGKNSSRMFELFLKVAPIVFIAGLMLLVSLGAHLVAVRVASPETKFTVIWRFFQTPAEPPLIHVTHTSGSVFITPATGGGAPNATPYPPTRSGQAAAVHWSLMNRSVGKANLWEMVIALISALILAWRVDINEFSMHLFYRNRLARCYLGASRPVRHQNPFTGFSAADDLYLASLCNCPKVKQELGNENYEARDYEGPYPLVNTALNVTSGEQLAWQSRKARSFFFSPLYCGFEVQPEETPGPNLKKQGYRETFAYAYSSLYGLGGPLAGTAMGISGAAASPNMGYHSSAPLAFLLTVFNVRLGWWMGNPRRMDTWIRSGPRLGLPYLFYELIGEATARRGYVYLSDGGHFENLGIYELVQRRCNYIIACDGSADPKVTFEDLGNAIEKCRVDLGVDITLDVSKLKPPEGSRNSAEHCAVGQIHYQQAFPGEDDGFLLYFKSSLTGDEPVDVRHYSEQNTAFPHTTTANQFFDEAQFESYRELGYHIIESAFGPASGAASQPPYAVLQMIKKVGKPQILTSQDASQASRPAAPPAGPSSA